MNAVKGRFADGAGSYTKTGAPDLEMARRIMHDDKYHSDKELIMKPIEEFEHLLNSRTQQSVDKFVFRGNLLLAIIAVLAIFTALSIFFVSSSVNGVLRGIVAKLKEVTAKATSATSSLVDSAATLSASSTEQAASIQETVATLDEIKAMVNKSLESARASADLARVNNQTASKGREAAVDMQRSVSDIDASNTEMIKQIQESNQQLSEIVKIISDIDAKTRVINDIVFQTKLLSFNASVEAARAGEHGKGFAVVAEEVGNLASMSGNAAKEISSMLEGSIRKVDEIAKTMSARIQTLSETSRQKMERGTQTADHCGDSFKAVADSVSTMNEMMEAITRASEEQAHGVSEISKAMQQLSETTNTNTTVSHETASHADSLKGNTDTLQSLVSSIETEILGASQGEDRPVTAIKLEKTAAQSSQRAA
jgi:methyl-accepting chemotaxis protein